MHSRPPVVSATRVKAGSPRVVPLDGEAVRHSDGQAQQDGERHAATRLRSRLRQAPPQRPLRVGGDALDGHEPCLAQVRAPRLHSVLVCQPGSHRARYDGVADLERLGAWEEGPWSEGPACRRRLLAYRVARAVP